VKGFNRGVYTPGCALRLDGSLQPLEALVVFVDGADVCLEDEVPRT
jgi:hypothetical protein